MDSNLLLSTISGSFAACIALTFLYAAYGKLRSPDSVAAGLASLKVPFFLRQRVFAAGLPYLEIAIALGLLVSPAHWYFPFACAAFALTAGFLIVVWAAAAREEPAQCNCFGKDETTVGWWTVTRNAVLLVISGTVLLFAPATPGLLWRDDQVPVLLCTLALAGAALGAFSVASEPQSEEEAKGGPAAEPIRRSSDLGLRDMNLKLVNLPAVAGETPIVLIFTQRGCHPCQIVFGAVKKWANQTPALTARLVVNDTPSGAVEEYPYFADHLLLDSGKMASRLMGVSGYPTAFLVGRDGTFATDAIEGSDAIIEFLSVLTTSLSASPENQPIK